MPALVVASDTLAVNAPVRASVGGGSYMYEKRVLVFTSGAAADTYDFTLQPLTAPCRGGSITITNTINTAAAIHTFVVNPPTALVATAAIFCSLASTTGATVAPTVKGIFSSLLINSNAYQIEHGFVGDIWKVRDTLSGASLTAGDTITVEFLRMLAQ